MEKEEEDPLPIAILNWDSTAEEELRSIEDSYIANSNSKRKATSSSSPILDLDQQQLSKGRRLPNWATFSADSNSTHRSWPLSPSPCQFNLKVRRPHMIFGGRIVYCRTSSEVEQAATELFDKIKARKQNEDRISLGFDIEWRPTFQPGKAPRKAALMQICMDTSNCYIFHIIHSGIPPVLKSLLEDCSTVKVGVWIANDAKKISRDYNVIVGPLDDLSQYANLKLGGPAKRWSLSSLTEMLTCKEDKGTIAKISVRHDHYSCLSGADVLRSLSAPLRILWRSVDLDPSALAKPPKIRMGNWEATSLSREQLQYAATDAFASWYLYEVIKAFPEPKPDNEDIKK